MYALFAILLSFIKTRYVQLLGGGSGGGCFGRGYTCSDKELNIAVSRLKGYFSLVLITDTSLHFRVGGVLMKHRFGWLASADTDKARRGTQVEVSATIDFFDGAPLLEYL